MVDQTKIDAVREYLQIEFPNFQVDDTGDFERLSQKFRVYNDTELYIIKFERIFFKNTSDIKKTLQNLQLSKFMRNNNQVLVTSKGLLTSGI